MFFSFFGDVAQEDEEHSVVTGGYKPTYNWGGHIVPVFGGIQVAAYTLTPAFYQGRILRLG